LRFSPFSFPCALKAVSFYCLFFCPGLYSWDLSTSGCGRFGITLCDAKAYKVQYEPNCVFRRT
jgi:hypothetical protein